MFVFAERGVVMEYLYSINPVLTGKTIIIYGIGERERSIFAALLQQEVYVTAFSLQEGQESMMKKILNKRVITFKELTEDYSDAYVIIAGERARVDVEVLRNAGIENVIVENITLKDKRMVFLGE